MALTPDTPYSILNTQYNFGRIGVLMGGPSTEREISMKSGKAVYEALKDSGFDAVAIDIKTDDIESNKEAIKNYGLKCAFIALHGRFGEDGQIQHILEGLKIPYTGSGVRASRLAMDKIASRKIFVAAGLTVPRYDVLERPVLNKDFKISADLNLPLVVKPATHGSSIGLSIVGNKQGLKEGIESAFAFDNRVIIEEYIKGREMTVGILGETALPVIEIIPKNMFFDFEAKYHPGLTEYVVPAELEEDLAQKVKEAALAAHRLLGCYGCSRVDMILGKDNQVFVLEVNTIPGLTATSLLPKAAKSAGIEFKELCYRLIKFAHEKGQTRLQSAGF